MELSLNIFGNKMHVVGNSTDIATERNAFMEAIGLCDSSKTLAPNPIELDNDINCAPCIVIQNNTQSLNINEVFKQNSSDLYGTDLDLNIGDSVTCRLKDGQAVTFDVTHVEDAAYRFEMRELLETMPHTDIDEFLKHVYAQLLPDVIQKSIVPCTRYFREKGNGDTKKFEAHLFIPSASEVFSPEEFEEYSWLGDKGLYQQLEFYKLWPNRIRCTVSDGKPNAWWLLSAYSGSSTYFAYVSSYGNASNNVATYAWIGAPVCFHVRRL